MKVLLAGASGALGVPIARHLIQHGHDVLGLTRDPGAVTGFSNSALPR